MTPIAGFVLAIVAGTTLTKARAGWFLVWPWLAVLAVQTVALSIGLGHNPPSSVIKFPNVIGYTAVQLLSLGLAWWAAVRVADRSRRGHGRHWEAKARLIATAAATGFALLWVVVTTPAHPGHGDGQPPVLGLVGLLACLITGLALSTARRISRSAGGPGPAASAHAGR